MAKMTATSPAAAAYAQALLELAEPAGKSDELADELEAFSTLMAQDKLFRGLLMDPAIASSERWGVLQRSFGGQASELFVNFLGVANEKNRFSLLPGIAVAYRQMLDQKQNRVRVEVTVAQGLDEQQMQEVQQRVSGALGKTAVIEQKVDQSIIGGLVIRVQDRVMDGSVKAQLEAIRKQLLTARVSGA
jgi:F-type H+-transporting ATPase subunit delta